MMMFGKIKKFNYVFIEEIERFVESMLDDGKI
jgi:hypothetical protein